MLTRETVFDKTFDYRAKLAKLAKAPPTFLNRNPAPSPPLRYYRLTATPFLSQ